jgi:hypothetical protein
MQPLSKQELRHHIDTLDLSFIQGRMVKTYHWSAEEARKTSVLYRHFLFLCATYPKDRLAPSKDIDEFWHNHILDTKQYQKDCDDIFGHYLHHSPDFRLPQNVPGQTTEALFQKTQERHFQEFGEYIYKTRYGFLKKAALFLKKCCKALFFPLSSSSTKSF